MTMKEGGNREQRSGRDKPQTRVARRSRGKMKNEGWWENTLGREGK